MRTGDETARQVLTEMRTWAVIGASDDPWRSSYGVMEVLIDRGYDVIPVNPNHSRVLGLECFPSLATVPRPVDVVDLFRRSDQAGVHVDEAVAVGARAVWTQLDVFPDEDAMECARQAGLVVVVNRCPAQDIPRLLGVQA